MSNSYKSIGFMSDFHYMLNGLASEISIKPFRVVAAWLENSVCKIL